MGGCWDGTHVAIYGAGALFLTQAAGIKHHNSELKGWLKPPHPASALHIPASVA